MKRLSFLSLAAALFFLTSCETTREIVIGSNGDGSMSTTVDMSQLIGIAKMSGKGEEMKSQKAIDTTMSFASLADSLDGATPEEKELVKKGTMNMIINMEDDKFIAKMNFPFTNIGELAKLDKLSGKMAQEGMKSMSGKNAGVPDDEMPQASIDDYFTTTYSAGLIERKLNKEKYAAIGDDKGAQALKEVSEQGMPISSKIVINLPRPAKKVEGASAKLSDDKKKVTIETDMSDFFDDATKMEFKIEY
ncbi:MAG: hypothetical protein ACTHMV_01535 [Chitinophagaceae bacterium]